MNRFKNPQVSDVPELVHLFRDGETDGKKDAALALGTIGSIECVETIRAALADADDSVRSYAMIGIRRGMEAGRSAKGFLDAVFPDLSQLLDRSDQSVGGDAPLLLLSINEERAIPVLYSPQYFTTKNPEVHYILRALNRHEIQIPHDRLLPLLAELKDSADKYPRDYTYEEALVAYGIHPDAATDELLRKELNSPNEQVRQGAAKGLLLLHRISNAFGYVCQLMETQGFKRLTERQQYLYAVTVYRSQVNNGGHSQYFFNSSGDHWKSALLGLRTINATTSAKVLSRAVALFEPDDVPRNRERRIELLLPLRATKKEQFDNLDAQFYAAGEDLVVMLALYAIDNKSDFIPES
jgi:hypothetical protein